jgi:dipeptidase E
MANIFLTSSLQTVAKDLSKHIGKDVKKFLFIITASEVEKGDLTWLKLDRDSMTDLGYELEDYTVTDKTKDEVAAKLKETDGIIMAGGNTFYLIQQLQKSDSIEVIREFVKNGGVYIGSSAGSVAAGPSIYNTRYLDALEKAPDIKGYEGLNLTDISVLPHWGSASFKDRYMTERLAQNYNTEQKIILMNDFQYLIVENDFIAYKESPENKIL